MLIMAFIFAVLVKMHAKVLHHAVKAVRKDKWNLGLRYKQAEMIFLYIFVAFHVPSYTDGCPSMSTIFIPCVSILINYNTWPLFVFSLYFARNPFLLHQPYLLLGCLL